MVNRWWFSFSLRVFRGESSVWKSLLLCSKASVLPDTVRRIAFNEDKGGPKDVTWKSEGKRYGRLDKSHTVPLFSLLSNMHQNQLSLASTIMHASLHRFLYSIKGFNENQPVVYPDQ